MINSRIRVYKEDMCVLSLLENDIIISLAKNTNDIIRRVKWFLNNKISDGMKSLIDISNFERIWKYSFKFNEFIIKLETMCPIDLFEYHTVFCDYYNTTEIVCGDFYGYRKFILNGGKMNEEGSKNKYSENTGNNHIINSNFKPIASSTLKGVILC